MSWSANAAEVVLSRRPARPHSLRDCPQKVPSPLVVVEQSRSRSRLIKRVGPAVVVVVTDGDAHAVSLTPGDPGNAGFLGSVDECAVAVIPKEPVTGGRGRGTSTAGRGVERSALNAVDVEPAVAVEVDQGHASRLRLGDQVQGGLAVIELKNEPGRGGVSSTGSGVATLRCPRPSCVLAPKRAVLSWPLACFPAGGRRGDQPSFGPVG